MSAIPTRARQIVWERQDRQCARCGNTGREIHHRQRRREAGHGLEILVGLCGTCHRWAHANPKAAQPLGYIVPPWTADVASVPLKSFMGWVLFDADGNIEFVDDNELAADDSELSAQHR
jgi:hypothetical protein